MNICGYTFHENELMTVITQIRFPRSKKRRIRKKWFKNPCNVRIDPCPDVVIIAQTKTVIGHPVIIRELVRQLEDVCVSVLDAIPPNIWDELARVDPPESTRESTGIEWMTSTYFGIPLPDRESVINTKMV